MRAHTTRRSIGVMALAALLSVALFLLLLGSGTAGCSNPLEGGFDCAGSGKACGFIVGCCEGLTCTDYDSVGVGTCKRVAGMHIRPAAAPVEAHASDR